MPGLTVNYAHCWESMLKGIDEKSPYYKVSYYIQDWTQADTVANELRGYTQRAGGVTYRVSPHQHPLSPNLFCADVTIEGVGNAVINTNGYPSYDKGFFAHCTYRPITWVPGGNTDPGNNNQIDPTTPILWCTQELDFSNEEFVLEKSQYKWSDNTPAGIPVRVPVGVTDMVITYHQLPYMPMSTVRSLRNKINNATFLGAPAYTIWFKGAKTTRDLNTDGTISQRVSLVFKERDIDWNKYLKKDGTWDYLKDGSSNKILASADLSPLIQL